MTGPRDVPAGLPSPATLRPDGTGGVPRATWHRRAGFVPLAYIAAVVAAALAHAALPEWRWLLIHLLLLGSATNAIMVWSTHFAAAVLRIPAGRRRAEATRLVALNVGVLAVLVGGTAGPAWLGITGAAVVFGAAAAHLAALAARVRRALPAPYAVTAHYYLAATVALLTGIPVGAWMLVLDDADRPRLLLFHAHVNLLGWITLTVLGTLLTLWPTVLRTRMADGAARTTARALPIAVGGLVVLGAALLAWWPVVAALGIALFGGAVALVVRPAIAAARRRPPESFAAWSIAAGVGWLLLTLVWDAVLLLRAAGPAPAAEQFETLLVPLLAGFVAQVLLGALAYLLPMALGGGPVPVRERTARLDRYWAQRVGMANAAVLLAVLPVPGYLRTLAAVLLLVALVQFLVPALSLLLPRRR